MSELGHERPDSPTATRKRRISHLFSRERAPATDLPSLPMIQLFASPKPKGKKKALLTMRGVSQAFAVYPERPELISRSTLMKLEGQLGDEDMAGVLKLREAWLLVMPELEGSTTRAKEMLKWIIGKSFKTVCGALCSDKANQPYMTRLNSMDARGCIVGTRVTCSL